VLPGPSGLAPQHRRCYLLVVRARSPGPLSLSRCSAASVGGRARLAAVARLPLASVSPALPAGVTGGGASLGLWPSGGPGRFAGRRARGCILRAWLLGRALARADDSTRRLAGFRQAAALQQGAVAEPGRGRFFRWPCSAASPVLSSVVRARSPGPLSSVRYAAPQPFRFAVLDRGRLLRT
jgi:hypothetical protein